jgi:hypothetical protein
MEAKETSFVCSGFRESRHSRRSVDDASHVAKYFVGATVRKLGIIVAALAAGQSMPATAEESYPWCVQDDHLSCYYMTREQCEQTVNYHGFCVANPNVQPRRDRKV